MKLMKAYIHSLYIRGIFIPFLLLLSIASYGQSPNSSPQSDSSSLLPVDIVDTAFVHETDNYLPGQLNLERGKLSVYPNPASDKTQVGFIMGSFGENNELNVVVIEINGKTRIRKSYPADENKISLDTSGLNPGTYIIVVHDEWGRFMSEKLVVL